MKKLTTLFVLLFAISVAYCQNDKGLTVSKDTNYVYSDTIKNKVYYGDYDPTGLIKTADSSYIISVEFHIYFPELTDTTYLSTNFKKYLDVQNLYEPKQHISSGSILKLNKMYKREWEVIFKDKRVESIKNYDSLSLIVAGEEIFQKKVWVAKINIKDGRTIWVKEFGIKHTTALREIAISFNKDIEVLTESRRIIPLSIRNYYGKKKIVFFKQPDGFEQSLSLTSISADGSINWSKQVAFKKKYDIWGAGLAADSNITVFSTYSGFDKPHGKFIKSEGQKYYQFNLNGQKKIEQQLKKNDGLMTNISGWLELKSKSDTVFLQKFNGDMKVVFSTTFKTNQKYKRIQSILKVGNSYYVFGLTNLEKGDFLICKLDSAFSLLNSWTYKRNRWGNDPKLIEPFKGDLVILEKCYDNNQTMGDRHSYANLVELHLQ